LYDTHQFANPEKGKMTQSSNSLNQADAHTQSGAARTREDFIHLTVNVIIVKTTVLGDVQSNIHQSRSPPTFGMVYQYLKEGETQHAILIHIYNELVY